MSGERRVSPCRATVAEHFAKRPPEVHALYRRVLAAARKLGKVTEDPNASSIHLVRKTAFAGVAARTDGLLLSFKSVTDLESPRIVKRERPSTNRWYLYVKLATAKELDREVLDWLATSWDLSAEVAPRRVSRRRHTGTRSRDIRADAAPHPHLLNKRGRS